MAILQRSVQNISINQPQLVVGQVLVSSQPKNDKFYSSSLLNYIEAIEIGGVFKTLFYTETSTNINVGDRVFISNGNYDSNEFSKKNKYTRYSDGYRVLSINGCRIVLDIDYTGHLPYNQLSSNDFILVHNIESQKEFDYINSLKIPVSLPSGTLLGSPFWGEVIGSKVRLNGGSLIYVDKPFSGSSLSENFNGGIQTPGFYVRNDDGSNNFWENVSSQILTNKIIFLNRNSSENIIYIEGKSFDFSSLNFREGSNYRFDSITWKLDIRSKKPYLSKSIFRFGNFKGTHNDGIFGNYDRKSIWKNATWFSGVILNTEWRGGILGTKNTNDEILYNCRLDTVGTFSYPVESLDTNGNRGFGYNFIEDSQFFNYSISNGNFYNTTFLTQSDIKSALDIYYKISSPFTNVINGGKFELCDIYDTRMNNAYGINSLLVNTNMNRTKLVSCEAVKSSLDNGYWSSDGGIKILGADIWTLDEQESSDLNGNNITIRGTIKLYISEKDYFKLNQGDVFYISHINKEYIINSLTDDEKILFLLENRYLIDSYNDYDIVKGSVTKMKVSLSSTFENNIKYFVGPDTSGITSNLDYKIADDISDFWVDITSLLQGEFDDNRNSTSSYNWGDIVFDSTSNKFYRYLPYDRVFAPGLIIRANSQRDVTQYLGRNLPSKLTDSPSDWVEIGDFRQTWKKEEVYNGTYIRITGKPNFNIPSGSVIGDDDIFRFAKSFFVFVGERQNRYNGGGSPSPTKNVTIDVDNITGKTTNCYYTVTISINYKSKNYFSGNKINLPSIDITSDIFGFYQDENNKVIPTLSNKIKPITLNNVDSIFRNTIIQNGDFKSGVMSNSTWLSGDNTNYSNNIIQRTPSTNLLSASVISNGSENILNIILPQDKFTPNYYYDGYDLREGDYVWIKSLSTRTKKNIFGKFIVKRYFESTGEVYLGDITGLKLEFGETAISQLSVGDTLSLDYGLSNNYFSIHKFNLTKSTIKSGKFIRTGIDNSTFYNESFKKYEYPNKNIQNTNILRLVNLMFQSTNNIIKSGLFYKSHFINEGFDGGIFYDSIWYGGKFTDGLFKNSVWVGGEFLNGKFVDNRNHRIQSFDFDTSVDWKLWQGGTFSGGEFYNSLWPKGVFNGGRLYYSEWTGGVWNDGILGSNNFQSKDTTMGVQKSPLTWGDQTTKWFNGVVENAIIGGDGVVDWYGGKMVGGEFTSNGRESNRYSIWHDGDFYGSSFTKLAWWKNGRFFSGKFLSEIGWTQSNFLTQSSDIREWGWVDGEFYGGEFGNASLSSNSLWYSGTMEGGIFKGKIWRSGIFTNGKFYGSLNVPDTDSDVNPYLFKFKTDFYGLWLDGYVNPLVSNIKKDTLIKDNDLTISTKNVRRTLKAVDMYNVVWKTGTFSHEISTFNNSVWLDGEFNKGYLNDSFFNPYVDLTLSGTTEKTNALQKQVTDIVDTLILNYDITGDSYDYVDSTGRNINFFNDGTFPFAMNLLSDIIFLLFTYVDNQQYDFDFVGELQASDATEWFDGVSFNLNSTYFRDLTLIEQLFKKGNSLLLKFYSKNLLFIDRNKEDAIFIVINNISSSLKSGPGGGGGVVDEIFTLKTYYPKYTVGSQPIPYSYNVSPRCVWKNGIFEGREFNYSTWHDGTFNDGVFTGGVWKSGTFNYGKMVNSYWENGIWRNGTWDGSPFDKTKIGILNTTTGYYEISDNKTQQLISRIYNHTNIKKLHLLNVYELDGPQNQIHQFDISTLRELNESIVVPDIKLGYPDWFKGFQLEDIYSNTIQKDHYLSAGVISSYKIYLLSGGREDIFTDFYKGYKIEIKVAAKDYRFTGKGGFDSSAFKDENGIKYVNVEFKIGPLDLIIKRVPVTEKYDEIQTFDFYYQPTDFDIRTKDTSIWIRRSSPGTLKIIDSKVTVGKFKYSDKLNNRLYDTTQSGDFNLPSTSDLRLIELYLGNNQGEFNGIKFGNGAFISGLWKTGVWNNGWRGLWGGGDDLYYFDKINLSTFKQNENLWYLKIDANSNTTNITNISNNIKQNDFISLSNVVGIDLNEERYLLKDYYRVTKVESVGLIATLTIEIPVSKFPLRRFEIDSDTHLIYLSKNIWLGGTFLNGYFRGIWNYGLFKGFPYTTVMDNSHFVSGKFDGGRFISQESTIIGADLLTKQYHTGLVQFFEFYDNNISEKDSNSNYIDNTYQSWMDLVFYKTSYVNINSLTSIYDDNFGKLVPLPNLYGYPTLDVLSSYSKFKNTGDSGLDYYRLGTKFSIYTDYLEDNGYFRKAFNSEGKPGLKDFTDAGWRVEKGNFYGTPTVSFIYNSNITRRNFNKISMILATFGYNVLNNDNIQIQDKRYSVIEYDLEYFQRGFDPDTGQPTNSFSKPLNLLGSNYSSINNIYKNGIIKTEYFYNKNALDLILRYNSEYVPPMEKLSMFGYNVTHSIGGSKFITPTSEFSTLPMSDPEYYNTTYSLVFPASASQLINNLPVGSFEKVRQWDPVENYRKFDIVRRATTDAFGAYYISLRDGNQGNDLPGLYNYTDPNWVRMTIGFNNPRQEFSIFEQADIFDYFTSVRINYFKFLEVDALPFFNYYDFEINFFNTYRTVDNLSLEFLKPHGLKVGDFITISLDERKYNPQYETLAEVISFSDYPKANGDIEYSVRTNLLYGNTVSYLAESGVVKKDGNRIDKRIQPNYYKEAPKVEGLDETFIYLGNNQIVVDRDRF